MSESPPMVRIEWVDSRRPFPGWIWFEDYEPGPPCPCVTIGYLIHKGPQVVSVAPTLGDSDDGETYQMMGVQEIPVKSIMSMRRFHFKEDGE